MADPATLDQLRAAYDGLFKREHVSAGRRLLGGQTPQIMMPYLLDETFADNPAVTRARAVAAELLGYDEPECIYSMLIFKPGGHPHETPWHQDMAYAAQPVLHAGAQLPSNGFAQF